MLVAACAGVAMIATPPAFADDPVPSPNNPDVLVGSTPETEATPVPQDGPVGVLAVPTCGARNYKVSSSANSHQGIGAEQSNYNKGTGPATMTFTAQVSGTVQLSYTGTASADAGIILSKASAALGVTLSASITASLGNTISFSVGPKKWGHAAYGVWRKKTVGQYCHGGVGSTWKTVTAYSPWRVGWVVWES
ncbi:hypothetical protein ACIBG7_18925 [Nonomuraea sp. NPDC050328]|uniref:hypothetical protein n=1 Tax=Nonomuraea sp. NPDC050328 TaxID=3364361 RepID=UPI0037BAE830